MPCFRRVFNPGGDDSGVALVAFRSKAMILKWLWLIPF